MSVLFITDPGGHHTCGGSEGSGPVPAHCAGPSHQEQWAAPRGLPHPHQRPHLRTWRPGLQVQHSGLISAPDDLDFRYSIVGSSLHPKTWTSGKVWAGLKEVERAGFHVQYNGLDFMLKGLDFTHKGLNFVYRGWTWCTMGWISCTVGWTSLIKGCTYKGRDFMYKSNYLRVLTWGYLVRRLQRCLWQLCRL